MYYCLTTPCTICCLCWLFWNFFLQEVSIFFSIASHFIFCHHCHVCARSMLRPCCPGDWLGISLHFRTLCKWMNNKWLEHFNTYLVMICLNSIMIFGLNNAAVLSSVLCKFTTMLNALLTIRSIPWIGTRLENWFPSPFQIISLGLREKCV